MPMIIRHAAPPGENSTSQSDRPYHLSSFSEHISCLSRKVVILISVGSVWLSILQLHINGQLPCSSPRSQDSVASLDTIHADLSCRMQKEFIIVVEEMFSKCSPAPSLEYFQYLLDTLISLPLKYGVILLKSSEALCILLWSTRTECLKVTLEVCHPKRREGWTIYSRYYNRMPLNTICHLCFKFLLPL